MFQINPVTLLTKLLNIFTFVNFVLFGVIIDIFAGVFSITFFSFTNREGNERFSLFEFCFFHGFITFDIFFLKRVVLSIIHMIILMKKKRDI